MRPSNGPSEPCAASVDSAPVTSAAPNARSASNRPARASAVETWVPLRSARPSLGRNASGSRPACGSASCAGTARPSSSHVPSPISAAVMCASGARSPEAPQDPCAGITGRKPTCRQVSSRSMIVQRTPDAPRASAATLSASTSRTTRPGSDSPTPEQCDNTRLRWRVERSAASIETCASLPKPVLTPYTGLPWATMRSIVAAPASTAAR